MSSNQSICAPSGKFAPPRTRSVDVDSLSEADLASLRKSDPFMYHSIPAVHRATLSIKDVDPADVKFPELLDASEQQSLINQTQSRHLLATQLMIIGRETRHHFSISISHGLFETSFFNELQIAGKIFPVQNSN